MDSKLQEIREKIQSAELVLVGLGEGFQYGWGALAQDERYREIEREIGDEERGALSKSVSYRRTVLEG